METLKFVNVKISWRKPQNVDRFTDLVNLQTLFLCLCILNELEKIGRIKGYKE